LGGAGGSVSRAEDWSGSAFGGDWGGWTVPQVDHRHGDDVLAQAGIPRRNSERLRRVGDALNLVTEVRPT
ncbi:hypothetical protein NGM37_22765, partial [Streptomyces sp. TRM76130]|nr:hypothetical protein [Streptomyces sp. TRM76130]